MTKTYSRPCIAAIQGYVPGEQPRGRTFVKLNTNENPYPPSAKTIEAAKAFDLERLRLYSEPSAIAVRQAAARRTGLSPDEVICGNGSDDLLTIAVRTFVDQNGALACTDPSYSLYPVLADLQGARVNRIELDDQFQLPEDAVRQAGDATLLLLARPNAPTGNSFPKETIVRLCEQFHGIVWIDEAYADFANDNCLDLVKRFDNVVVSRTLSKSYSLAGLRLGIAFANTALVFEMNKVKDSYNVDMFAQTVAAAALDDSDSMRENVRRIRQTRDWLAGELARLASTVHPSETNFLFVRPPVPADHMFAALREHGFLVRYFNLPRVSDYIRITIGTREDMEAFLSAYKEIVREHA